MVEADMLDFQKPRQDGPDHAARPSVSGAEGRPLH